MQTIVLQCMQEQKLDALVTPTATIPPPKLNGPREPNVNGRSPIGWSLLGQQGFPVISVPAGFTTEVWDRVRDGAETASRRTDAGQAPGRRRLRRPSVRRADAVPHRVGVPKGDQAPYAAAGFRAAAG